MQAISQVATGMLCDNEWERKKRSMESRTGISEATAVSGAFILYKAHLQHLRSLVTELKLQIVRSPGYTCLEGYKSSSYIDFREVPLQIWEDSL